MGAREHEQEEGQRKRVPSGLHAISTEHNVGLKLTNSQTVRSWPELKSRVGRSTDWTTQAPQEILNYREQIVGSWRVGGWEGGLNGWWALSRALVMSAGCYMLAMNRSTLLLKPIVHYMVTNLNWNKILEERKQCYNPIITLLSHYPQIQKHSFKGINARLWFQHYHLQ